MNDLISRQAALEAIEKMNIPEDMCVFEILSHIEVEIATLPPAQPDPQWIPCEDCERRCKRWENLKTLRERNSIN